MILNQAERFWAVLLGISIVAVIFGTIGIIMKERIKKMTLEKKILVAIGVAATIAGVITLFYLGQNASTLQQIGSDGATQ